MDGPVETGSRRLLAEIDGPIARVTFSDPARHNAMGSAMWQALKAAFDAFSDFDQIRAVRLQGAGTDAFVSGADIAEFERHRNDPGSAAQYEESIRAGLDAIRNSEVPVLAIIRGYCMGAGVSIAAAADIRLVADDSRFAIPAARLGLGYPLHAIGDLVAVAGLPLAKELLLTADSIDAETALRHGLANRVVTAEDLPAAADALAARLAANAPLTLRAARRSLNLAARLNAESAAVAEIEALVAACYGSEDYAEGRAAFTEKRRPDFRGR